MYIISRNIYRHLLVLIFVFILVEVSHARRRGSRIRTGTSSSGSSNLSLGWRIGMAVVGGVCLIFLIIGLIRICCARYGCWIGESKTDADIAARLAQTSRNNQAAVYSATNHVLTSDSQPEEGTSSAVPEHPKTPLPTYPLELPPPSYYQAVGAKENTCSNPEDIVMTRMDIGFKN